MSKTALPSTPDGHDTEFRLLALDGPAVVAGEEVVPGTLLDHDEYGTLECRGYGWSNGALGWFLKLVPVETDADVPEQWSLDKGAPNSLPDAYAANELSVVGGEPVE